MISRIEMFGFKSTVGYQLDRHDEKLFDRYNLRNEKIESNKHKKSDSDSLTFSEEYKKAMSKIK